MSQPWMNYQGQEETVIEGAVPPRTDHSAACTIDRASYCPTVSVLTPPPVSKDLAFPTASEGGGTASYSQFSQTLTFFILSLGVCFHWFGWVFLVSFLSISMGIHSGS